MPDRNGQSTDSANKTNVASGGVTRRDDDVNRGSLGIAEEARGPRGDMGTGEQPTPNDRAGKLS